MINKQQQQQFFFIKMQNEECELCEMSSFAPILSHALYSKYSSMQKYTYYTKQINQILEDQFTKTVLDFQEQNYIDDDHEYLKRQYGLHQFNGKIQMLTEYYKFHRNVNPIFDPPFTKIMNKYYDKVKENDYKKIKRILKDQQNISLTTQKSQQSFESSQYERKSKYSTVLDALEQSGIGQSKILGQICQKIQKAFYNVKINRQFKGTLVSGQKQFQSFLERENLKKKKKIPSRFLKINKINYQNDKNTITSNKLLRGKSIRKKSAEKTTVNETVSREEKNKRADKGDINLNKLKVKSAQLTIQKNQPFFKQISNMILFNSNSKIKTIDQIYCAPSQKPLQFTTRKNSNVSNTLTKTRSKTIIPTFKKPINTHQQTKGIKKVKKQNFIEGRTKKQQIPLKRSAQSQKNLRMSQNSLKRNIRTFSNKQLPIANQKSQTLKYKSSDFDIKKAQITIQKLIDKKLQLVKR